MTWYAEINPRRRRQVLADVVVLAWTGLWVRIGYALHDLLNRLAAPGRAIEGAGEDLRTAAARASERVADLPAVGGALAAPFDAVADVGRALVDAGTTGQDVVAWLAVWPVLAVVLPPLLLVPLVHVVRRLRWARDVRAAAVLNGNNSAMALFALRALVNRPLSDLREAAADPYAAYAAGDHDALAALELRELGLKPRAR